MKVINLINKTVCELFAGVGGFRVGLGDDWETVWANQWEPGKKQQHAFNCYIKHFGEKPEHVNEDIGSIDKSTIPDHNLLVGGFPCLTAHTKITTSEGEKDLIDVKVGDFVLSHDNQYHEVTKFMKQGRKPVFELCYVGTNNPIFATENHRFYVKRKKDFNNVKPEWISVQELLENNTYNDYYICSFAKFFNSSISEAIYEDDYVWLPFYIFNPDRIESVYDIEVKDSHSFIANNCITHNCQDYSVAHTGATGIEGKKGVLWWDIRDVLIAKKPKFVLLENVDRLLKSPAKQRGRDFGVILACFNDLGYNVEWRVITASDYGFPQKRKRTFIFAYRNDTTYHNMLKDEKLENVIHNSGFFYKYFPIDNTTTGIQEQFVYTDVFDVSDNFKFNFLNSGIMANGIIYTENVNPITQPAKTLGSILESNVSEKYNAKDLDKWAYLKGNKRILRTTKEGFEYWYTEGAMAYPDYLDRPARTMLTSEGSLNRTSHILEDPETKNYRILTPMECERINGFPDNWTNTGMPERMRYFCMGNALVVGLITNMSYRLDEIFKLEQ